MNRVSSHHANLIAAAVTITIGVFSSQISQANEAANEQTSSQVSETGVGADVDAMEVPKHKSSVSLSVGGDNVSGKNANLDANFVLGNGGSISAGIGSSQMKNPTDTIKTTSARVGYHTDPVEDWSFGIGLENWGEKEKLVTNALRGDVTFLTGDWEFSANPEIKGVQWFIEGRTRALRTTGTGLTLRTGFYGVKKVRLGLSISSYKYSNSLDRFIESDVFYESALDLASSFLRNSSSVSASYSWTSSTLELVLTRSQYEYLDTISQTATVSYDYDFTQSLSAGLVLGSSKSQSGTNTKFGTVSTTFRW